MGTILVTDTGIQCLLVFIIVQIFKERGERHAKRGSVRSRLDQIDYSGLGVGAVRVVAAAGVLVEFSGLGRMQGAAWWSDFVVRRQLRAGFSL
jgi:hypothetical protein